MAVVINSVGRVLLEAILSVILGPNDAGRSATLEGSGHDILTANILLEVGSPEAYYRYCPCGGRTIRGDNMFSLQRGS